ncbi:MAG: recombination regulator RecX [Thermomicrobium sp.]|nr:recombination regulator RecX [Thermomicrobium sp.]
MEPRESRITGIAPAPRRSDRFIVERDGTAWVSLSAARIAELGLQVGEWLSSERVAAIERASALEAAQEVALRLLAVRPRSEAELATRLRRKGYASEIIEDVLRRLRMLGYLDDRAFAEAWVTQRRRSNPRGPKLLRRELRDKGIAPDLIEAVVPAEPEEELRLAREVARKHWPRLASLDRAVARRRLAGLLERRGFSWTTIRSVLSEYTEIDPENA